MNRKPYPTDLTEAQWDILESWIPPPRPGGRPRKTNMREVVNGIFYLTREGCSWRALPHDFPPWKTVYNYFEAWKRDGTWDQFLTALRRRVRRAAGRNPYGVKADPMISMNIPAGESPLDKTGGLVGQPLDRIDGPLKVTGRAPYAYEYREGGALAECAVRRQQHQHCCGRHAR